MQSNHMERMHMWSSFKILIEDLRLSSNVAITVTKNRKLLSIFFFLNLVKSQLPPNFMEMMHIWSTFKLMVANPGRLWKMAAIITKNRFFFFFNSLNIVKEQCIYNSLSYHEWWPWLPSNMAVATFQTWKLVKKNQ